MAVAVQPCGEGAFILAGLREILSNKNKTIVDDCHAFSEIMNINEAHSFIIEGGLRVDASVRHCARAHPHRQ